MHPVGQRLCALSAPEVGGGGSSEGWFVAGRGGEVGQPWGAFCGEAFGTRHSMALLLQLGLGFAPGGELLGGCRAGRRMLCSQGGRAGGKVTGLFIGGPSTCDLHSSLGSQSMPPLKN